MDPTKNTKVPSAKPKLSVEDYRARNARNELQNSIDSSSTSNRSTAYWRPPWDQSINSYSQDSRDYRNQRDSRGPRDSSRDHQRDSRSSRDSSRDFRDSRDSRDPRCSRNRQEFSRNFREINNDSYQSHHYTAKVAPYSQRSTNVQEEEEEPSWDKSNPSPLLLNSINSAQTTNAISSSSIEDEIIFEKRCRSRNIKKARRHVIDLEPDDTPAVKIEPREISVKVESTNISLIHSTSKSSASSTVSSSVPITTPIITPAPALIEEPMEHSHQSEQYPLVGMSLKMENYQFETIEDPLATGMDEDRRINQISVICTTCHLRVVHWCEYNPEHGLPQTITPSSLYVCKCNFLFHHKWTCGKQKKKDSFAPESKQRGLIKQVDRIHRYECHKCKFKFAFEGLRSAEHYFMKLRKLDLTNASLECPIFKKCDEISRSRYRDETKALQQLSKPYTSRRSLDEYITLRRNSIHRCSDDCCRLFHECYPYDSSQETTEDAQMD